MGKLTFCKSSLYMPGIKGRKASVTLPPRRRKGTYFTQSSVRNLVAALRDLLLQLSVFFLRRYTDWYMKVALSEDLQI